MNRVVNIGLSLVLTLAFLYISISIPFITEIPEIPEKDIASSPEPPFQLEVTVKAPFDDIYQVFYDLGSEKAAFTEKRSAKVNVKGSEQFQTIRFDLPALNMKQLRIDPGRSAGTIILKEIRVDGFDGVVSAEDIFQNVQFKKQIDDFKVEDGALHIRSTGRDPYFGLHDISRFFAPKPVEPVKPVSQNQNKLYVKYAVIALIAALLFYFLKDIDLYVKLLRFLLEAGPKWILVCLFFIMIWLPATGTYFGWDHSDTVENRALAEKPQLERNMSSLMSFPKAYENYFNDRFAFRNRLLELNNYMNVYWLKKSPTPKVEIGQNGFLFYAHGNVIEDYKPKNLFTPQELETIKRNLEERRNWLQKQGISFVVMVAPNKHSIYTENLPNHVKGIMGDKTRLDQVLEYLREHSDVQIVDVRDSIKKSNELYRTYHKTDTHWNDFGAFIGYQGIMKRIKQDFPDVPIKQLSDYTITRKEGPGGDLARMMGMQTKLKEERITLNPAFTPLAKDSDEQKYVKPSPRHTIIKQIPNSDLAKALVFRDSFTNAMIPYLSESFSRIVYVWDQSFNTAIIQEEKPDVFIHQMVERHLGSVLLKTHLDYVR
jgi:hypothetical protein